MSLITAPQLVIFEKGYYFITPKGKVKKKTVTIPATVSSS
jgi:hypothetical protein